jgi:hypothetical protein
VRARTRTDAAVIPIHTVASVKGLEADGVILFISPGTGRAGEVATSAAARRAPAYVGVSRARILLHFVAESATPHALW